MPNPRKIVPIVVAAAMVGVTTISWHPGPSASAVDQATSGVSFDRRDLPAASSNQGQRPVQPSLEHIAPWISAVGSSVGSMDLRKQGFSGDACMTDPRDDSLKVFAVPGSKGASFPTFKLTPEDLPYDDTMAPIGCVPTDIDQDGRQDIVAYYWGRSPVIFRNVGKDGDTPAADMFEAQELVAPSQVWNSTALNVADIDGDGNLDIIVGNYFPDDARVLDPTAEDDQNMEMQRSMGGAHNAGPNRVFLGAGTAEDGSLKFKDASERWPAEASKSWSLAFGLQDLSGNGIPDIFAANDFGPDQMLVNRSTPGNVKLEVVKGNRDLLTAKSKVMGNDSFKGMGVAYSYDEGADLPSIFISNITSPGALHESNLVFNPDGSGEELLEGNVPYKENSTSSGMAHSGWSWDIKPIDPTNSGQDSLIQANGFIQGEVDQWPRLQEVAMGNDQILSEPGSWLRIGPEGDLSGHERNRFWHRVDGQYTDIGEKAEFSKENVSRGFAVADVNDDGRQDFLVANQWETSHAHINTSKSENEHASLRIVKDAQHGVTPVIGAKVTIEAPGYRRRSQVFPANGHSGVSGSEVHFALPDAAADGATATVEWSDKKGTHSEEFAIEPGNQQLKVSAR